MVNEDTRERPVENSMYWLSSRFYVPEWGRFLTPDDIDYLDSESINGLNLCCYCLNNPVMFVDPSGHSIASAIFWGGVLGIVVELATDFFEDDLNKIDHTGWDYTGAFIGGSISGGFGEAEKIIFRLIGTLLGSVAQGVIAENKDYNFESFKRDFIIGMASFGISEATTIIGKKILRKMLNKIINKTSKEASKQIRQIINGRIVKNLRPNTEEILKIATKYNNTLKAIERSIGYLYSFITSACHNTIVEW